MKLSLDIKYTILLAYFFGLSFFFYGQNSPTEIFASGNQLFCPGTDVKIVTDFNIIDTDDTGIQEFFIQISSGYQSGLDILELQGTHSNILQTWSVNDGKLTLSSTTSGAEMLFQDLISAVKDVVFRTTATIFFTEKNFSLTIDDANYLPATDHFYEFISASGISWQNAKIAAEIKTYYGRQGYLATLTSQEEADFAGKQATGTGWIGASDSETEGVWKWVTGPEAGTIFWNGNGSGSSPAGEFANWNLNGGEPNNYGGNEHFAHITHPNLNVPGKWNDLPDVTSLQPGNDYYPQGYIVEYGAPGDPTLKIAAITKVYMPQILSTTTDTICESGTASISANASEGEVVWYDSMTAGLELGRGVNFTTPILNTATTFYASISMNGCSDFERTPVLVNVTARPTITSVTNDLVCSGTAFLTATPSSGSVFWYETATSATPIASGVNFRTPILTATKSYFVAASNFNCVSSNRTEVIATLDPTIPSFNTVQNTYVLCNNIGSVVLQTTNALDNYRYIWTKDGAVFSGDLPEITTSQIGVYTVKAVSLAGCESLEQTIVVKNSEIASVENKDLLIRDNSGSNSIEVVSDSLGIGTYEFALDAEFGTYKNTGYFDTVAAGTHTLYIRDKGGCGTIAHKFSILEYADFFTPNNDGVNDYWNIIGFDKDFYTRSDIYIYNRYGVLIHKIDANTLGWDGTYEGKILPSNTYWFSATLTDINGVSLEKTGSFSLTRK